MPAAEGSPVAVECVDLHVDHRTAVEVVPALQDVSAAFASGRLAVVAGPSGSGKSTLLQVIAGLHRPRSGSVRVGEHELTDLGAGARRKLRRRTIGVVLQNPSDNLLEYLPAIDQVRLAARLRGVDPAEATDLLEAVGLADHHDRYPSELSGGEQQRVAFAAAIVGQPVVLLADEPTAQLDAAAGGRLIEAVRHLVERGTTAILASHDAAVIEAADDVVWLHDGRGVDA